jgi:hypothetical protein
MRLPAAPNHRPHPPKLARDEQSPVRGGQTIPCTPPRLGVGDASQMQRGGAQESFCLCLLIRDAAMSTRCSSISSFVSRPQ